MFWIQSVILSFCHPVILSSCHSVILSSCHPVILSSYHQVFLSSHHHVIMFLLIFKSDFKCLGELSKSFCFESYSMESHLLLICYLLYSVSFLSSRFWRSLRNNAIIDKEILILPLFFIPRSKFKWIWHYWETYWNCSG